MLHENVQALRTVHIMATTLLTATDVSQRLGVDRSTVYRMATDGRIDAVKVGNQWRFPAAAIASLLDDGMGVDRPTRRGGDVPLRVAREAVLHAAAPLLGVSLVVTDMRGELLTDVANPCRWFTAHAGDPSVLAACTTQWRRMAGELELTSRLEVGGHGFACARAFVRDGDKLAGLVVAGGIAPVDHDEAAAGEAGLHHLDERARVRLLSELPRVAAAISDLTSPRTTSDPRSAR